MSAPPGRPVPDRRAAAGWLLADLALIIVFAAAGRSTHDSGLAIVGIAGTAAPFLVAYLLTWSALRAWRSPGVLWPTGVLVWLGSALGGLALRALWGGGMAISFQLVAIGVLAGLLLLPRFVAGLLRGRRTSG